MVLKSLSLKLTAAFVAVVLVSVGLMAFLTASNTEGHFQQYLTRGNTSSVQSIEEELSDYYKDNGSWEGLQLVLEDMLSGRQGRVVVADSTGLIIADTKELWAGTNISEHSAGNAYAIFDNSEQVATFYTWFGVGSGGGQGSGSGSHSSGSTASHGENYTEEQQTFLEDVRRSLWISGILGAIAAIIVGLFVTRRLTQPLKSLSEGASQVAKGDLSHRVKVTSSDEIGELAKSFNSMAHGLEASEKAKQRLLSDITHELRTPLTVIEGTVDAIKDGVYKADSEHLGIIKEQAELLTRLIDDLKVISLAEAGKLELSLHKTDINQLLQKKAAQVKALAKSKGVKVTFTASEKEIFAEVDSLRIEQVIGNLLSNALRYTSEGGEINMTAELKGAAKDYGMYGEHVLIKVADTGEGIDRKHLPHIFDRFYRSEDSRARIAGGTGLGLSIVKQMVEAHKGCVWAESKLGRGSAFYVALPLKQ